jgi:hypothetical protein
MVLAAGIWSPRSFGRSSGRYIPDLAAEVRATGPKTLGAERRDHLEQRHLVIRVVTRSTAS